MPTQRCSPTRSGRFSLPWPCCVVVLLTWLTACAAPGDPTVPDLPGPPTQIVVEMPLPRIEVGEIRQATASALDAQGRAVAGRHVTWSSEDVSIATVDQDGVITGVGIGNTRILVTSIELVGAGELTVTPARVGSVKVSTPKDRLTWGATTRVMADVRDRFVNPMVPGQLGWSSSRAEWISVDQAGIVTAHVTGTAWIRAHADDKVDSLLIISAASGVASVEFAPGWGKVLGTGRQAFPGVIARNAAGDHLLFPTRLVSSDSATVQVNLFILNARGPGVAQIGTTVGSMEAAISVTVVDHPRVEKVTLTASASQVAVGEPVIILMETRDGQGNLLHDRAKDDVFQDWPHQFPAHVKWNGDTLVFAAGVPGTYFVRRQVENREGGLYITVVPDGRVPGVCERVAGAMVLGDDGQYLGHLTNHTDPASIQNRTGRYGSPVSSTSIYATWGIYSVLDSPLSAMNPWATRPPRIVKDGLELGRLTLNPAFPNRVSTAVAQACAFQ
jgi:hypothetical protein